jgi:hypothetical protein
MIRSKDTYYILGKSSTYACYFPLVFIHAAMPIHAIRWHGIAISWTHGLSTREAKHS